MTSLPPTNPNTIVLITGANTGLGFETVKALLQSSSSTTYTIILSGRSIEKANAAAEELKKEVPNTRSIIETLQLNIEDDTSIARAFEFVEREFGRLDVLVNNAGATFDNVPTLSPREMWDQSWNLNVTSTHLLTHTLVPLLLKSSDARLIFLTSGTANLTDAFNPAVPVNRIPAAGWPKEPMAFGPLAYRSVKTGLNMVMKQWQRILTQDNVKVWSVSPGFLATGLGGNKEMLKKMGAGDPAIGGVLMRSVVEGERDGDVGLVVHSEGKVQPW